MNLERQELIKLYEISRKYEVSFEKVLDDYTNKIEDYLATGKKIVADVVKPVAAPQATQVVNEKKTIEGVYKGREMISEGTKKDGSKWVLYKVKVLTSLSDKPLSFTTFNGTRGFHEITEGEKVLVEYTEEERVNKDGNNYVAKKAVSYTSLSMDDIE